MSKIVIQKLLELGIDLNTKTALKKALRIAGFKGENVDHLYIELKNNIYRKDFENSDIKSRTVFLPQCLRSRSCKAKIDGNGYECRMCGKCKISVIKKELEPLGYKVFVVPGASMLINITKREKPDAILGVACLKEILMATNYGREFDIPMQAVMLLRDGCVDTDVDLDRVFDVAKANGDNNA